MTEENLGAVLTKLFATIESRRSADADLSYTASLLSAGPQRCAKKFGEEAVEALIAATSGDKKALTEEAADVLYHLAVMLTAVGVRPDAVADVLVRRQAMSGHEEKASRKN